MALRIDFARSLEKMTFQRAFDVQRAMIKISCRNRVAELCGADRTHLAALEAVLTTTLSDVDVAKILRLPPWYAPEFPYKREEFCKAYERIFERASRIRLERDVGFLARIRPWVHPRGLELHNASLLANLCETLVRRQDWHVTVTAYDHARDAKDVVADVCDRFRLGKKKAAVILAQDAVPMSATMVRLVAPGTPSNPERATHYLYCAMVAAIQIRSLALLWSGVPLPGHPESCKGCGNPAGADQLFAPE